MVDDPTSTVNTTSKFPSTVPLFYGGTTLEVLYLILRIHASIIAIE